PSLTTVSHLSLLNSATTSNYALSLHDALPILKKYLREEETENFRQTFMDMHPYEQASFFKHQPYKRRMKIYSYLSPEEMSEIMEYIELEDTEKFLTEMDSNFATMIFSEMA